MRDLGWIKICWGPTTDDMSTHVVVWPVTKGGIKGAIDEVAEHLIEGMANSYAHDKCDPPV